MEIIVWGVVPIIIAVSLVIGSVMIVKSNRTYINFALFLSITTANLFAIFVLINILSGAWPTYIPHVIIVFSLLLFVLQYWMSPKK